MKLSESQAGQALEPLLKQIGQTTDPAALQTLAQVLQTVAPNLSETQGAQAARVASASLAWASRDEEAAAWARALVALLHPVSDRDRLLTAIAYPTAAGSATEVLLNAIRADHPDAPAKEAGTEATLAWLAKKFPDVLRPPHWPEPLQPGLKCP